MSTAKQRAMARRRRIQRRHMWGRLLAVLCLIAIPFAIWQLDWPYNLLAALPLGVMGLYLAFFMPGQGGQAW